MQKSKPGPANRRGRLRPYRAAAAGATALALGAAGLSGAVLSATAAPSDDSEARAQLIHGSLLEQLDAGVLEELLEAVTTEAGNPSDPGPHSGAVDVGLLEENINVKIGEINLPLIGDGNNNGLLDLGAGAGAGVLNGYAASPSGQEARAASGAVTGQGAIDLGAGDDAMMARLDLTALLGQLEIDELTNQIVDDLSVGIGALATTADAVTPGEVADEYAVAGLELSIRSPLLDQLTDAVETAVAGADDAVNGILGPEGTVQTALDALPLRPLEIGLNLGLVNPNVSVNLGDPSLNASVDLSAVVNEVISQELTDANGLVGIDLSTGTIRVDLDKVHAGGLNGLDPNTNILTTTEINKISAAIAEALGDLTDNLDDAIRAAVAGIDLNVALDPVVDGDLALIRITGDVDIAVNGTVGDSLGLPDASEPTVDIVTDVRICLLSGLTCVNLDLTLIEEALGATVTTLLSTVGAALDGVLDTAVGGLGTTVDTAVLGVLSALDPLNAVLAEIATLTVNAQPGSPSLAANGDLGDDSFTVRALSVALLPSLAGGATLDLASSTVRTAAPAAVEEVAITAPADGQVFTIGDAGAGLDVEVTGTGEPGAGVTVTVDGENQSAEVGEEGNWSVTAVNLPEGEHTATATQDVDGTSDSVNFTVSADPNAAVDANASASASASANADDDSNAAAQAAAQAAATADAGTEASAASDATAAAAAQAAADEDASSDASADVGADASAEAAAQAAAMADSSSDTGADASAAADADAAAASEAAAVADASTDASAAAAADADPVNDIAITEPADGAEVDAGDVTVRGTGEAGADITVDLKNEDGDVIATQAVQISSDGSWYAIFGEVEPGDYRIEASQDVDGEESFDSIGITVIDPDEDAIADASPAASAAADADATAEGDGTGALPDTGAGVSTSAIVGAALLMLIGATALVVTRRKTLQS